MYCVKWGRSTHEARAMPSCVISGGTSNSLEYFENSSRCRRIRSLTIRCTAGAPILRLGMSGRKKVMGDGAAPPNESPLQLDVQSGISPVLRLTMRPLRRHDLTSLRARARSPIALPNSIPFSFLGSTNSSRANHGGTAGAFAIFTPYTKQRS